MEGHEQRFAKGEFIFKEGTWGDRVYEVLSGEVLVYKTSPRGNPVPLATLGPGTMFGEMFLLSKEHRHNATAVAITEVVLSIHFEDAIIQDLVDMTPRQRKLIQGLTDKLNQLTENYVREISDMLHGKPDGTPEREKPGIRTTLISRHEGVREERIINQ